MKLSVEGYKSIAENTEITFSGLTVLAGSNSSGKSSFMQPFLLLKQTLENHYDRGTLMLDGANIKLADSSQLISKVPTYKKKTFSVAISIDNSTSRVVYKLRRNVGVVVDSVHLENDKDFKNGLHLSIKMKHAEIVSQIPENKFKFFEETFSQKFSKPLKWRALRNKCFIEAELGDDNDEFPMKIGIDPTRELAKLVTQMIHVPGLRGNPERTYKVSYADKIFPGTFEKYIASIIFEWKKSPSKRERYEELAEDLNALGLANAVDTKRINDTQVQIRVPRFLLSKSSDTVNIADVGFGISQILPVLVALLVARKDQLVYIEQPELHLHPNAQFKLAEIISRAVNRGVRVVIETNSSILLRGIQILVAKKILNHEKISLNWFTQSQDNGATIVSSEILDERGAFGNWPVDFDDISLKVEQSYLDAVEELLNVE